MGIIEAEYYIVNNMKIQIETSEEPTAEIKTYTFAEVELYKGFFRPTNGFDSQHYVLLSFGAGVVLVTMNDYLYPAGKDYWKNKTFVKETRDIKIVIENND